MFNFKCPAKVDGCHLRNLCNLSLWTFSQKIGNRYTQTSKITNIVYRYSRYSRYKGYKGYKGYNGSNSVNNMKYNSVIRGMKI